MSWNWGFWSGPWQQCDADLKKHVHAKGSKISSNNRCILDKTSTNLVTQTEGGVESTTPVTLQVLTRLHKHDPQFWHKKLWNVLPPLTLTSLGQTHNSAQKTVCCLRSFVRVSNFKGTPKGGNRGERGQCQVCREECLFHARFPPRERR